MLQGPGVDPSQVASDVATQVDPQRRFIRTAQAQFQVKDVYRTALAIEDEVASQGGFVVDNDIQSQVQRVQSRPLGNGKRLELAEYRLQGALTVRVPSERTQVFLRAIASQMEFLDRRNFSARDAQFELLRQQLAASVRSPATSTTQARQLPSGRSGSLWHRCGSSVPWRFAASKIDSPSNASTSRPSSSKLSLAGIS